MSKRSTRLFAVLVAGALACAPFFVPGANGSPRPPADDPTPPNDVDYVMYTLADVRDADACAMTVRGGELAVAEGVTNPAMSCPDMTSWKLFVEAVRDSFWTWSTDDLLWPRAPVPPCSTGNTTNPRCPIFPGRSSVMAANEPSKAHGPAGAPGGEIGRIIRQENAELVYRNRAFFDYVVENDLYYREGVQRVFAGQRRQLGDHAPYHGSDSTYLTRIDFPIDAVMIKSNWLQKDKADSLGMRDDPANPFIVMSIRPDDHSPAEPHYLLAFHISSKDIPNWVWTTFEHVSNFGRCDFTGCNDAYGYPSPDALQAGDARNFTRPHVMSDELGEPAEIFDIGKRYPDGGRPNPGLDAIFTALGIGARPQAPGSFPSPADRGWRSYRLKGSQVDFTDATGRPTLLGNSITEGGFMNTASCMSCHARAAVTETSRPLLGVFIPRLSEVGYAQSNSGVPDPDWFVQSTAGGSGSPPRLLGIQTDFVWGLPFLPDTLGN